MGGKIVTIAIARFATIRAVAYSVFCLVLIVACLAFFSYLISGQSGFVQTHGVGSLFFLVIGWFAGVIALLFVLTVLKLIVFSNSLAVWANEDDIIYVSKHWISAPKDKVVRVSLGTFGRFDTPAIVLHLKNGRAKFIPVGLLSEEPQIIVTRLKTTIAT